MGKRKARAVVPLYTPAPAWVPPRCEKVTLYHGCTTVDKANIDANGIDLSKCRVDTDFGRGFYTTTVQYQARQWANNRYYDPTVAGSPGNQPVVLTFVVDRHRLAELTWIGFVLADPSKDDYWSLVQHCRQSTRKAVNDHKGPIVLADETRWYDVACGPVSAFWWQKFAMQDADQVSFHTPQAVRLLNRLIFSGDPGPYQGVGLE